MTPCVLYPGRVGHYRHAPQRHGFTYALWLFGFDLERGADHFDRLPLAGWCRPAWARFHRADHLGDPRRPLAVAVRDLVAARTGRRPAGPVELITNVRQGGYWFNPVSFYLLREVADGPVTAWVLEVTNTPWRERHCYVLDARCDNRGDAIHQRYRFAKTFHVSPFMDMDQEYDCRLAVTGRGLAVHMITRQRVDGAVAPGPPLFEARFVAPRRPLTPARLRRALVRHPVSTARVVAQIHWQALRLWRKRVPFHPHPGKQSSPSHGKDGA